MAVDFEDFIVVRENARSTRKLYKTSCDDCGKDTGYKRRTKIHSNKCRICFNKTYHKNKCISVKTKKKMSESQKARDPSTRRTPEISGKIREKLSKAQKKYCSKYGNQFSGREHSNKTKSLLSFKNSGKEPKWKGRVFQYDGPQGSFKMRSSYELAYANWLDKQKINWIYEPKFKLSNGKTFSPDFQLSNDDIIEIKGFWTKIGREKWNMFVQDYPDLNKKVLMKSDLIKLGLEVK
jgi:predicted nuclease of restriction endonuclease-like RecB superfamily